jgi:hypothetical protein
MKDAPTQLDMRQNTASSRQDALRPSSNRQRRALESSMTEPANRLYKPRCGDVCLDRNERSVAGIKVSDEISGQANVSRPRLWKWTKKVS